MCCGKGGSIVNPVEVMMFLYGKVVSIPIKRFDSQVLYVLESNKLLPLFGCQ